jgi:hypothetical protein
VTTWRELITRALEARRESWNDVCGNTLKSHELDIAFDAGFGSVCGKPFTMWTHHYVYFPVAYDGAESVASAPRHLSDEPTYHVGGGSSDWGTFADEIEQEEKLAKGWLPLPEPYRRAE